MFQIVTVCTANICRSPLAELLLADRLDPARFAVSSAGVYAREGDPMDVHTQRQARRFGLDGTAAASSRVSPSTIDEAGLILTATRQHRSDLLGLRPTALRRTFTLTEFADLVTLDEAGDPDSIVAAAAANRSRTRLRSAEDFDIPDPYRGPYEVHAQVATQIFEATQAIAERLNAAAG